MALDYTSWLGGLQFQLCLIRIGLVVAVGLF
jgi:hypothetical protein